MFVNEPPAELRDKAPLALPSASSWTRWAIRVDLQIPGRVRASLVSFCSSFRVLTVTCGLRKLCTFCDVSEIAKDYSISPMASAGAFLAIFI